MRHQRTQATPKPRQETLAGDEIDRSCRLPLVLLLAGASAWLLIGATLALIASLQLHVPSFLADYPFLTYGRIRAAQGSALLYGFAIQGAFALSLWLLSRIGRKPMFGAIVAAIAAVFWNFGTAVGLLGIMGGDTTGFDGFEIPRYATPILFASFVLIGLCAAGTLYGRQPSSSLTASMKPSGYFEGTFVSQWFVVGALIWFGWIYANTNLLLLFAPVRGVLQASIGWWYLHNVNGIVLTFVGLATAFYFVPQELGRPLHSKALAILAVWMLALFGTCGGIAEGAPLPAWLVTLSLTGTVMTTVPVIIIAVNFYRTLHAGSANLKANIALRFICAGLVFWFVAALQMIVGALPSVSSLFHFTFAHAAGQELFFWGFYALTLFGAVYKILPRILQSDWPFPKLVLVQFWCVLAGTTFSYLSKMAAGVGQGFLISAPAKPFMQVLKSTLPGLRASTAGDLLIFVGVAAFSFNLGAIIWTSLAIPRQTSNKAPINKPASHKEVCSTSVSNSPHGEGTVNYSPLLYLGLFMVMGLSWVGFILGPVRQLGSLQPGLVVGTDTLWHPSSRPGLAAQGAQIYRANGCADCHTQQVRPSQMGSDLARGWGRRRSVARDYIFDQPPLLGSQRIGPDLTNIGARKNAESILLHLYNPQGTTPGSIMPPYRFLFKTRTIAMRENDLAPGPAALALTAYLISLHVEAPLYEAPVVRTSSVGVESYSIETSASKVIAGSSAEFTKWP